MTQPTGRIGNMRRLVTTTALAVGLFALACTDERQESPTEPPSTATTAKTCPSSDPIQSQICSLFRANDLLQSASDFYNNIKTKLAKDPKTNLPKDLGAAQSRAADLINFTFKQFYALKLNGGSSSNTQSAVVKLSCDVFGLVSPSSTTCPLTSSDLSTSADPHSAVQACGPDGCLVLPPDKHSG